MVLVFTATDQSRLVQRLLEVCRAESMRASLSALTALCDKAENDIRSCLNTLQVKPMYSSRGATTGTLLHSLVSVWLSSKACHWTPQMRCLICTMSAMHPQTLSSSAR